MNEQSIVLVSLPSLLFILSTFAIFSCLASSVVGIEKGKPVTIAFVSRFSGLSSVMVRSGVFLKFCKVWSSRGVSIHSPLRFGRAVRLKLGCLRL